MMTLYFLFSLLMFVLMLKASLMAHRCSFREDVREEGCPRCRPMGVSRKVRDEDSLCRLTLYKYKNGKATAPGLHWTACCPSCPSSLSSFQEFLIHRDVKGQSDL